MNKTAEYWVGRAKTAYFGHNKERGNEYLRNAYRIQQGEPGGLSAYDARRYHYLKMIEFLKQGQNAVCIPHSRKGLQDEDLGL